MASYFAEWGAAGPRIPVPRSDADHQPWFRLTQHATFGRACGHGLKLSLLLSRLLRFLLCVTNGQSCKFCALLLTCGVTASLVSRGEMIQKNNAQYAFLVAPVNVDRVALIQACDANISAGSSSRSCVSSILVDAQTRCGAFMDGLVLTENSVNTGFDMNTTLLCALATVFGSLSTVHPLSAGASVSSGRRTVINANIAPRQTQLTTGARTPPGASGVEGHLSGMPRGARQAWRKSGICRSFAGTIRRKFAMLISQRRGPERIEHGGWLRLYLN
jgi:hypothetical protein